MKRPKIKTKHVKPLTTQGSTKGVIGHFVRPEEKKVSEAVKKAQKLFKKS